MRIALTEPVHWILKDYGLSELDAYELLSKVAKLHLDEMVDPNCVVASVEKKYQEEVALSQLTDSVNFKSKLRVPHPCPSHDSGGTGRGVLISFSARLRLDLPSSLGGRGDSWPAVRSQGTGVVQG